MTPAQCMFFNNPDIMCCPFNTSTMQDILCSWYSIPPLQSRHNVCHAVFPIQSPAPSSPAHCMSFYVPDLACCLFNTGTTYVILCSCNSILSLWPRHNVCYSMFLILSSVLCNPGAMYVILCVHSLVSCPSNTGTMHVILCSWYSIPPLWHRHNVWCSMVLS